MRLLVVLRIVIILVLVPMIVLHPLLDWQVVEFVRRGSGTVLSVMDVGICGYIFVVDVMRLIFVGHMLGTSLLISVLDMVRLCRVDNVTRLLVNNVTRLLVNDASMFFCVRHHMAWFFIDDVSGLLMGILANSMVRSRHMVYRVNSMCRLKMHMVLRRLVYNSCMCDRLVNSDGLVDDNRLLLYDNWLVEDNRLLLDNSSL